LEYHGGGKETLVERADQSSPISLTMLLLGATPIVGLLSLLIAALTQ
jgi:hypothetical protein